MADAAGALSSFPRCSPPSPVLVARPGLPVVGPFPAAASSGLPAGVDRAVARAVELAM
jgi:hypothetical protein